MTCILQFSYVVYITNHKTPVILLFSFLSYSLQFFKGVIYQKNVCNSPRKGNDRIIFHPQIHSNNNIYNKDSVYVCVNSSFIDFCISTSSVMCIVFFVRSPECKELRTSRRIYRQRCLNSNRENRKIVGFMKKLKGKMKIFLLRNSKKKIKKQY